MAQEGYVNCSGCGRMYNTAKPEEMAQLENHSCTNDELGECDTCGKSYELGSRENRCGQCGNCGDCCADRNDPAFYAYGDSEIIMQVGKMGVRVAGEMKVFFTNDEGEDIIIRTAQDLDEAGIYDDQTLAELTDEGRLVWENNAWFEVWDTTKEDEGSFDNADVFHDLYEAVEYAIKQDKENN